MDGIFIRRYKCIRYNSERTSIINTRYINIIVYELSLLYRGCTSIELTFLLTLSNNKFDIRKIKIKISLLVIKKKKMITIC